MPEQTTFRFCVYCGKELQKGNRFCCWCGKQIPVPKIRPVINEEPAVGDVPAFEERIEEVVVKEEVPAAEEPAPVIPDKEESVAEESAAKQDEKHHHWILMQSERFDSDPPEETDTFFAKEDADPEQEPEELCFAGLPDDAEQESAQEDLSEVSLPEAEPEAEIPDRILKMDVVPEQPEYDEPSAEPVFTPEKEETPTEPAFTLEQEEVPTEPVLTPEQKEVPSKPAFQPERELSVSEAFERAMRKAHPELNETPAAQAPADIPLADVKTVAKRGHGFLRGLRNFLLILLILAFFTAGHAVLTLKRMTEESFVRETLTTEKNVAPENLLPGSDVLLKRLFDEKKITDAFSEMLDGESGRMMFSKVREFLALPEIKSFFADVKIEYLRALETGEEASPLSAERVSKAILGTEGKIAGIFGENAHWNEEALGQVLQRVNWERYSAAELRGHLPDVAVLCCEMRAQWDLAAYVCFGIAAALAILFVVLFGKRWGTGVLTVGILMVLLGFVFPIFATIVTRTSWFDSGTPLSVFLLLREQSTLTDIVCKAGLGVMLAGIIISRIRRRKGV